MKKILLLAALAFAATADLLYVRKREIEDEEAALEFLTESMRVERDDLAELAWDDFDEIVRSLRSKKTRRLLEGLKARIGA